MAVNLTLEQKDRLLAILPTYGAKPIGPKRSNIVKVFQGILGDLVSGARWEDIDQQRYASRQTCQRYFAQWVREGVFEKAVKQLALELEDAQLLKLHESFIDGSFVESIKGARRSA